MEFICKFLSSAIILFFCTISALGQEPLWKQSSYQESIGNYPEAILLKKAMAKEDLGTEWYIDDIAGIARCYSYTNENDSTIKYCNLTIQLAERLINVSDSVAEVYMQSSALSLYKCGEYDKAVICANKVLALREKLYGKHSAKCLEWLEIMSYNALCYRDLLGITKFCEQEINIAESIGGISSKPYEDAITSIRAYAHQLVDLYPAFVIDWITPYNNKIKNSDVLITYQIEFDILLLEGNLALNDLKSADMAAHSLEHWSLDSYSSNIPIDDQIRIWLKLANYYRVIGDYYNARWRLMECDKKLEAANKSMNITQLVDRHNVELNLRMDTLGRSRINAEWLVETSTPIIEAGLEDKGTLSFFYNSRAWAYEGLEEYDKAIEDIKKSLDLNPLWSRKKKLGQLYFHMRNYHDAEKIFLELYTDETVPNVGRESIESDLMYLYWEMGDKERMSFFMTKDIENVKKEVRNAFTFLNEKEREDFINESLLGTSIYFDMYTSFSIREKQWAEGNQMAYNLALMQKGLLLNTTKDISNILKDIPDSLQNDVRLYEELQKLYNLPYYEHPLCRDVRIKLMNSVEAHPIFMTQLNDNWENISERLLEQEAAIEFINLSGIQLDNKYNFTPSLGALILRKNSPFPIFVKLASNAEIANLFEYGDDNECFSDVIYSGEAKTKIYNAIWEPMSIYLEGIETIYYSPAGMLQTINLDWIGKDTLHNLCDEYKLYRLSSTRELINSVCDTNSDNAILYGDITYSTNTSINQEYSKSKYRSTTRSGFAPLSKTAKEIDSIVREFGLLNKPSLVYKKTIATEESFRRISGNSPKVLHIATHGFYYSPEAIEKEYQSGNFIAFQGMNPELYHSGLALSGAQDTWSYSKSPQDITKFLELDSDKDGILLSAEISGMDLSNTDLVVLSACETALGNVTSEGVYGLQRAFKLAGVNSILMSLWKVDDDATQLLMTSFYKNYINGMSKRKALLAAQKLVKNTPGFEDPYNWAAFILLDAID